jgi:predicted ester cyclase
MAPTGKQLHVTGMSLFRFADGRIAEAWQNWDMLGLLHQIQAGVHPKSLYLTAER